MVKNLPNLVKDTTLQIRKPAELQNKIRKNEHVIFKMLKIKGKEKILIQVVTVFD